MTPSWPGPAGGGRCRTRRGSAARTDHPGQRLRGDPDAHRPRRGGRRLRPPRPARRGVPRNSRQFGQLRIGRRRGLSGRLRRLYAEVRLPLESSPDSYDWDIALLVLARPATVPPALLAPPYDESVGQDARIFGYGPSRIGSQWRGDRAGVLRAARVSLTPAATCTAIPAIAAEWNSSLMRCLGDPAGLVATCPQDSGGPAFGPAGLVGIISFSQARACTARRVDATSVLARTDCGPQRNWLDGPGRSVVAPDFLSTYIRSRGIPTCCSASI